MRGSITLHPEKGVNPKMTYCPQCKGEGRSLILLGNQDKLYQCRCGQNFIGRPDRDCPGCGAHWREVMFLRNIEEHEKLPDTEPCEACQELNRQTAKMVAEGGVYFRCEKCGSEGAVRPDHPLSIKTREVAGVEPPLACGVKLDECPQCEGKEVTGKGPPRGPRPGG